MRYQLSLRVFVSILPYPWKLLRIRHSSPYSNPTFQINWERNSTLLLIADMISRLHTVLNQSISSPMDGVKNSTASSITHSMPLTPMIRSESVASSKYKDKSQHQNKLASTESRKPYWLIWEIALKMSFTNKQLISTYPWSCSIHSLALPSNSSNSRV